MGERITEAELTRIEASMLAMPDVRDYARLVAEVRKLRGLIASSTDPGQSFGAILSQARALWAEAEAIRAEQADRAQNRDHPSGVTS